jgi:predicted Fe-S protein YdhL (DUF1289 family)
MSDRLDQWQDVMDEFKQIVWLRLIELEERVKELENERNQRKRNV